MSNSLERRPKRAASAQIFLDGLPAMKEAIDSKDSAKFAEGFAGLTGSCNACHATEKMAYLQVRTPEIRVMSVRGAGAPPPSSAAARP